MKSENTKLVIVFILAVFVSSFINALASGTLFDSSEVVYDNYNTGMNQSTVQGAVDDLYAAATDYSNLSSRVNKLEGYFIDDPTSEFMGHDLEIGKNETGNNNAYVDFWRDGKNRGGVGVDAATGNTVLLAKNEQQVYGTGTLELRANTINIGKNGTTVTVNGTNLIDLIYPVGSIYISVTDDTVTKVQNRFAGTKWESFGSGRTLVGVNTSDSDFNTVSKTGGSKTHSHKYGFSFQAWWNAVSMEGNSRAGLYNYNSNNTYGISGWTSAGGFDGTVNGSATRGAQTVNMSQYVTEANSGYTSTLQPYITVYMYKRTS